ncbi:MAG: hypothetical protein AAGF73_05060 [Actinomycetota bacterium]
MSAVPPDVLDRPVEGFRLDGATTLREISSREPTLLVFLRHFG